MAGAIRRRFGNRRFSYVTVFTYAIAALAWVAVVGRLIPMPGRGGGMEMTTPGAPEAAALAAGPTGVLLYLVAWGVMMVAMMYPSSAPLFRMYVETLEGTSAAGTVVRSGAFLGTYALVWTIVGVVPLVVNAVVPIVDVADRTLALGGSLVSLSAYQLSPYKRRCLRYCRTPLGFLMEYHRPGIGGAARTSLRFSVFCIGCCWALFAVVVVVGSMNLLWMVAIAVVLSIERGVAWGDRLAKGVGVVSGIGGGVAILLAIV